MQYPSENFFELFFGRLCIRLQSRPEMRIHASGHQPRLRRNVNTGASGHIIHGDGSVCGKHLAHGKLQHNAPAARQIQFAPIQHRAAAAQTADGFLNRKGCSIRLCCHLSDASCPAARSGLPEKQFEKSSRKILYRKKISLSIPRKRLCKANICDIILLESINRLFCLRI